MMTATQIVEMLGGLSACGRACECRPGAVSAWRDNNYIPRWRQPALMQLAEEKGIRLTEKDFPQKSKLAA